MEQVPDPVLKVLWFDVQFMADDVQEEQLLPVNNIEWDTGMQGPAAVGRGSVHEELATQHHGNGKEHESIIISTKRISRMS